MKLKKLNKLTLITLTWLMLFTLQASAQNDSVKEIKINKKPLNDFVESFVNKWENKKVDLTKPFLVEFDGTLNEDGTFDASKSTFTKFVGDKQIVNVVKNGIEAVGESGWFIYLKDLGVNDFKLLMSQDKEDFSVQIISKLKSAAEAKTLASGLNMLIAMSKANANLGDDETLLIESAKTPMSKDSKLILQIRMPQPVFQDLLNRNLKKASKKRNK